MQDGSREKSNRLLQNWSKMFARSAVARERRVLVTVAEGRRRREWRLSREKV